MKNLLYAFQDARKSRANAYSSGTSADITRVAATGSSFCIQGGAALK
jgi:hypothetical protein